MATPDLEQLLAEARHARERYQLYRARVYGGRPASLSRLRELERARDGAEARLRRARSSDGPSALTRDQGPAR